jgi:adenylate cyclase
MWKGLQGIRDWSLLRGARVAGLSASAGVAMLSLGGDLEEAYGLGTLFRVRGALPPPPGIVIAAMDGDSAQELGIESSPWPRTFHADLIRALDSKRPTAIVFDVFFTVERDAVEDAELAAALRVSGRGVLLQNLVRVPGEPDYDKAVDPVPPLRDAALATATFPVPADSVLLTSFWTFLSGTNLPTLPSVAFQLSASDIAGDWAHVLSAAGASPRDPDAWRDRRVRDSMEALRREMKMDSGVEDRIARAIAELEPDKARRLSALLDLYAGDDSRQLNFFGRPWAITTISYADIFRGDGAIPDVRGKIVLAGLSDRQAVRGDDTYPTFFSDGSGIDLAGVEILATALANLRDGTSLRSSGVINTFVVVAVAIVLGLAAATASDLVLGIVSGALLLVVPALGYALFASANVVVPVFTPLAVQFPVGILAIGLSLKTAERRTRRAIESAAYQFLPPDIAARLSLGPLSSSDIPPSRKASAIFLSTDVKGFATIAERLSLDAMDSLAKAYFGPLIETAKRHGGEILNMTGDSMMCAWYTDRDPARARTNAIAAALDMAAAVEDFGERHPHSPMPTRFGLRAGTAAFGVVGASGHYITTVVGDVTNTASRIDSLNKLLSTKILASAEVLENVDGLIVRPLGSFAPVGKVESVDLVEVLAWRGYDQRLSALAGAFGVCLAAFEGEGWSDAAKWFRALHAQYPQDGPTSFFLDLADKYSNNPPPSGTSRPIRVNVK